MSTEHETLLDALGRTPGYDPASVAVDTSEAPEGLLAEAYRRDDDSLLVRLFVARGGGTTYRVPSHVPDAAAMAELVGDPVQRSGLTVV